MLRSNVFRVMAVAATCFAASGPLHAQNTCSNQQINQAYVAMTMVPRGSGVAGECNPNFYYPGGPTWNLSDLEVRVVHARACSDPWIGQIYWEKYHRNPTSNECETTQYGGGSWSSYADLSNKIVQFQQLHAFPIQYRMPQYHVDNLGNLLNSSNGIVAQAGHYTINTAIVASGAGNIILIGGSNIILNGGGNIQPKAGMVINASGPGFIVPR